MLDDSSPATPEREIVSRLQERKLSLALAESCTGGLIASRITDIPGASSVFKGCVVCYANEIKERVLGIPQVILDTEGAVSASCATAMAEGVKRLMHADIGISVTGIAGPGGATPTKPVGLVYIAVATKNSTEARAFIFQGDRSAVRKQAADTALRLAFVAL